MIYKYTSKGGFARSYISKRGREWFEEGIVAVKQQTKVRKAWDCSVEVWIELHTCRFQDVDSPIKATLDLLEKAQLLENDNQVELIGCQKIKVPHVKDEKLVVEVYPLE